MNKMPREMYKINEVPREEEKNIRKEGMQPPRYEGMASLAPNAYACYSIMEIFSDFFQSQG